MHVQGEATAGEKLAATPDMVALSLERFPRRTNRLHVSNSQPEAVTNGPDHSDTAETENK
jgi:hypothetical protein